MQEDEDQIRSDWEERKSALMEQLLGKQHNRVMHSMIPFFMGGGLDLYYYPNKLPGTAIATNELSELPGQGPANDAFHNYELVMFTRHSLDLEVAMDAESEFGLVHEVINQVLNLLAGYCLDNAVNPLDTMEFPEDMPVVGGRCLMFDRYPNLSQEEPTEFGLLAIMEIFPVELEYARAEGTAKLLEKLREAGHYPYTDINRAAVV